MKILQKIKLEDYDHTTMLMAIVLTCLGVVMVYSASSVMAAKRYHDGFYFLKRQGGFAIVGIFLMLFIMRIDYHFWKRAAAPLLVACIVMLVMVFIPGIGGKAGGSSRWIRLIPGFNIQPSELAKIALIMFMAFSLDRKQDKVKDSATAIIPYMVLLTPLIGLLAFQPDLGSGMTLVVVALAMLFAAGMRMGYIISAVVIALPLLAYKLSHGYHKGRIEAWTNPWSDPNGKGFQIIQSWIALGTGGVFGQGLGEGKQKLFYLPEAHTDFILSVIGEELGFAGVLVIVGLFFVLVQRALRIAVAAPDDFGRFLAYGIAVLFGIQGGVNMCVVTGLFPTKGLALPFISYGGSSLLMNMFSVGILLNISSGLKISSISLKEQK